MEASGERILVVGINYSPEATGIAPYTTAMADSLAEGGARVRAITGIPHYPQWRVTDRRYRSGRRWRERLGSVEITRVAHSVPARATLLGRMRMEAEFFIRATREVRADDSNAIIAVTPSLSGAAAAFVGARGRPVGVVVQDMTGAGAGESGTTGRRLARLISHGEHALMRRAAVVGVITPRFGDLLRQHGVAGRRIMDLSNFTHIDPVNMNRMKARQRLGWPQGGTLVVHTGNMGMKQGLESVVEAARVAQEKGLDVTFVLVGDGNQRDDLELLGRNVRNLRFVDPVSAEEYPYVLAAADVLLLNERPGVLQMSLPSKLTSYVSARRPVLAAVERSGITRAVLEEDSAAALVEPGDAVALLAHVERLMADDQRRADLVEAAAAMGARRYGREAAARRYRDFARRLLDER
ncbi:glycosyltransferase [Georgenia sp. SYP-B2076]|uniref:glycosyltransferase n=1 Tax=Georgenia sp. SYP-B2076 TaxID=2495881 RepID=UPI001F0C9FA1|nr:glycosyltransferase [Georgenia sp. SYP-B2076]